MGFDVSQIPSTATVTNNSGAPISLNGFDTIAADAAGLVIDLDLYTGSSQIGGRSIRQQVWQAIVEAAEVTTERPVAPLTLSATNPNVLPLGAAAYDNRTVAVDETTAPRPGMPGYNGPRLVEVNRRYNTYVLLTFDKGVYHAGGTAAVAGDFVATFAKNGGVATNTTIASVQTTAGGALAGGETTIRVNLTVTGAPDGKETVTIGPDNTLVTADGIALDPSIDVTFNLLTALRLSGGTISATNVVTLTFPEPVYHTGGTAAVAGDFGVTFTKNAGQGGTATGASVATVTKVGGAALAGGETSIVVNLTVTGVIHGEETISVTLTTNLVNANAVAADATSATAELPLTP